MCDRSPKEKLSIEINYAGRQQEFYQTKYKNSTLEFYWTEIYLRLKKEYARLAEAEEVERFRSDLKKI